MNLFREDLIQKPAIKVAVPIKKHMMCLNEGIINPFDVLKDEIFDELKNVELNRYVSIVSKELIQELTNYVGYGVKESQILFGNGVDDLLYFIFTAVRDYKSSYALSLSPSYFDYKTYSGSVGLDMQFLNFNQDLNFSVEEYLNKLNHPDCKLGIICNPNNPTGHLIQDKKIIHILNNTKKPVLIDETYYEFSGKTFVDIINEFPNLIVTRSFSKSFSAAGLRFGYLISSEENISFLNKVIPVFNCSILTQTIALKLLKNKEIFMKNIKDILLERDSVLNVMKAYNSLTVYHSHTNFLTFSLGTKTSVFYEYLLDNDISVRPVWNHPLLANCLRLTISDKESNEKFIKALHSFIELNK